MLQNKPSSLKAFKSKVYFSHVREEVHPCGAVVQWRISEGSAARMSEPQETREQRMNRYKEERRKQLAEKYGNRNGVPLEVKKSKEGSSSGSEGPRATRASRLRAAASQDNGSGSSQSCSILEKTSSTCSTNGVVRRSLDKDKSAKRKSNLNRSLNSEEVPSSDADDVKSRRRRRRFFPQEVLNSSENRDPSSISPTSATARTANITANAITATAKTPPRKSDLSIHMENARRGVTPSYSEMGKYRPYSSVKSPKATDENRLSPRKKTVSSPDEKTRSISRRMEELTAFTRETLARVEKLTNKNKASLDQKMNKTILKKKSLEEEVVVPGPGPVSILKKAGDEHKTDQNTHTPPVTFSPNVVDPVTSSRKQGILKKRRSLDESQVMRHRSCSPGNSSESSRNSILKNQRRSSLEELTRTQSPQSEVQLQGILKRKTSRHEDDDSLNSPQSILKRRSGASSAGSSSSTPHVSITTAVILAAAKGAEMVLEAEEVKPILKKKSLEDGSFTAGSLETTPKPILKKKSSTDTDDCDEKPKKPILKLPKDKEVFDTGQEGEEYRPILKQRLSFSDQAEGRLRGSRRSNTIGSEFWCEESRGECREEDRELRKPRPVSVSELVRSFEKSTGAIPKRTSLKRGGDRYRTQPVTSNEFEASLSFVKQEEQRSEHSFNVSSLPDFAASDKSLNSGFLSSSSLHSEAAAGGFGVSVKSSSDSAFQSLGDGLELELELEQENMENKKEKGKLEMQMKAIAEEAKKIKLKSNQGLERYRSKKNEKARFSTQPVTLEEVQEAAKLGKEEGDDEDPCNMSLKERIKMFDRGGGAGVKKVPRKARFATQPVTLGEVEVALLQPPKAFGALASGKTSSSDSTHLGSPRRSSPRPKSEIVDEGISCSDSSDSELSENPSTKAPSSEKLKSEDTTSDGESSGGREVRNIFMAENKLKLKQQLESVLSKSRSHAGMVGDDRTSRSAVRRSQTQSVMPRSIADLRAQLKESGETEWRKRVPQNNNATDELKLLKDKNRYNDELSEKSLLAAKKDELDASSKLWKSRVEKSDAEKYSVAGRMDKVKDAPLILIPADTTKTPKAKRFRSKEASLESSSTPGSPESDSTFDLSRSKSAVCSLSNQTISESLKVARKVEVLQPDDYTFKVFFENLKSKSEALDLDLKDFDLVQRSDLLVSKKNVQVQKRRKATKNPIKALAERSDITNEYTEVIQGIAEREKKRLHIEKLSKNSNNKAIEALAGLASNEDFKSVALKKPKESNVLLPYQRLMLLQVKGRRHVQTRLVAPKPSSINEGDNFILITPKALYTYTGAFSNVIEQSRAADIANHIQKTGDMGCKISKIISVSSKDRNKDLKDFWNLLGCEEVPDVTSAGHPEEDETYESNILQTNMIYCLENDELVPMEKYWSTAPKIEMLQENAVLVFDFGSEMYVWSGKTANLSKKKQALKLAKEMWDEGFNYSDCNLSPLSISERLGARKCTEDQVLKGDKRPDWALFAKLTQHRETVLFREKFLDWPDFSRIIRVKSDEDLKVAEASFDIGPVNVEEMLVQQPPPDLVVQTYHLGRGDSYFEEETRRIFEFDTLEIKVWRVQEHESEEILPESIGQFYQDQSYIVSWQYRMTVKGRELNGKPSKHLQVGRDNSLFFIWHGLASSVNEKCTAAFLTVELDKQNAPQCRVGQGTEPAAFLRLFKGKMVVHSSSEKKEPIRLFTVRGELEDELFLLEVPVEGKQLRSRTSFVLIDRDAGEITIWNGCKSTKRKAVRELVDKILETQPEELLGSNVEFEIVEVDEGDESDDFLNCLGNDRNAYVSLLNSKETYDHSLRMFRMSSVTGVFKAMEVLCPHRSDKTTCYPFVQSELYSASQPALFLIDNHHELWLWQGWWPELEQESDLADQTGSGAVRWQAERKAAMQTAISYWAKCRGDKPVKGYLVWAGLEPKEFQNLFPTWVQNEDVAELNKKEGRKMGEMKDLEETLKLLSRTEYPLEELLAKPLPEGVDPTHLERYLSKQDFEKLLSMSKDDFQKLPSWKQTKLKKDAGLF